MLTFQCLFSEIVLGLYAHYLLTELIPQNAFLLVFSSADPELRTSTIPEVVKLSHFQSFSETLRGEVLVALSFSLLLFNLQLYPFFNYNYATSI